MKKYALIILLLSFPICNAEVIITEIMYNPNGPDTYDEYIEIYNSGNETVDLVNYTICDSKLYTGYINKTNKTVHLNTSLNLTLDSFALITDGGSGTEVYDIFNVSNSSLALHISSSSICGGLTNSGKTIFLNSKNITYDPEIGAEGDGNSLQLFNGTWISAKPTPGYECIIEPVNDTNQNDTTNNDSFSNSINISETECDTGIRIYTIRLLNSEIRSNYYLYLFSNMENQYATVRYWIEDLFGNYIRKPRNTNIDSKENKSRSFTPPKIYGSEVYLIKANIIDESCDSNSSNNRAEFLIGVKGEEEPEIEETDEEDKEEKKKITLEILEFPNEVKQGDNLTITIRLKNPTDRDEELYVYSYVYFGQQLASEQGWVPNRKLVDLEEGEETVIKLKNRIKESAEPTFWNIKVKVKFDEEEIEAKDEVKINEKIFEEKEQEKYQTLEDKSVYAKDNELDGNTIYVSDKERDLDFSKYLIIIIVLISFATLLGSRKDNFLKVREFLNFDGKLRDKRKDKGRSPKSKTDNRNSRQP
ncbi:MAG: lamin tail domain-containing protein [Candidatus Woesearchaeota archaeon]|nr:MAG: lamin tail domain-containing protein [Candidatus Woesearchaeota archaeon]